MFAQIFIIIIMCLGILTYNSSYTDELNRDPRYIKTTHELLIKPNPSTILSNRVLVYRRIDNMVYFLGYDGYGIYDITNDNLRIYNNHDFNINSRLISDKKYNKPSRIDHLHSYNDFSVSEREDFSTMFQNENAIKPISSYVMLSIESVLIDLDEMIIISRTPQYLVKDKDIYLYNGSNIMKVDTTNKTIMSYDNPKLGVEHDYNLNIVSKIKERYKTRFVELNSIHEFSNGDISIFEGLRNKVLENYKKYDSDSKYQEFNIYQL